eukprot:TRINITY_DN450_c1_g1_i1.p1 TRINITY_DN450_c1_g1~~TRINITY_DN450_c1_g1_i1.p1  ORF type:complete len:1214 (+),score=474.27 TRINITY_DN450_c1_g1_i1:214-3855(+)
MFIEEIIIDGFKSYAHRTVVSGFDPHFNAITGLNGSGKSNIFDAICFVLGITNLSQVRVGNLHELVYKAGQAGITRASVSIVFNNRDKKCSPVGYEEYDQITVTRQIVIGGKSKYLINGRTVQQTRVQNLFHSVQLNVNNPHFLIMQGRITKVLNMKPPEVLSMIEEAAGTRMFELKKESALKTIEKKDKKLEDITRILDEEITPTLSKLRQEREEYMEYSSTNTQIEKMQRFVVAYRFTELKRICENSEQAMKKLEMEEEAVASKEETILMKWNECEEEIKSLKSRQAEESSDDIRELETRVNDISKDVVKRNAIYSHAVDGIRTNVESLDKMRESLTELTNAIAEKELECTATDKMKREGEEAFSLAEKTLASLQSSRQAVLAGIAASGDTEDSLTEQIAKLKTHAVECSTQKAEAEMRIKHLSKEKARREKGLKKADAETKDLQASLEKLGKELERIRSEIGKLEKEADGKHSIGVDGIAREVRDVTLKLSSARDRMDSLSSALASVVELPWKDEINKKGKGKHQHVFGVVAGLMRVEDPKYAVALEVVAGKKLFHVVVDNEDTGKAVLAQGDKKLKKRITIVPLNKISRKVISQEAVKAAEEIAGPSNVSMALSLVCYEDQVEAAMQHVFGTTLVCPDLDIARMVAFDKKVRTRVVTLDGDMFDPSGTLSGGSRSSKRPILLALKELNDLHSEIAGLEGLLRESERSLRDAECRKDDLQRLRLEEQRVQHQLEIQNAKISQSPFHREMEEVQKIVNELQSLQKVVDAKDAEEKEAAKRLLELEKEENGFKNHKDEKLKELERGVAKARKASAAARKKLDESHVAMEQAAAEKQELEKELHSIEEQIKILEETLKMEEERTSQAKIALEEKQKEYDTLKQQLIARQEVIAGYAKSISRLQTKKEKLSSQKTDIEVAKKKLSHRREQLERGKKGATHELAQLCVDHIWIDTEKEWFGRSGGEFDFGETEEECEANVEGVRTRLVDLIEQRERLSKSVNKKVLMMIENAESEYKDLLERRGIVAKDKSKIEGVITELEEKKREALQTTWKKVNRDFGGILSSLLPGVTARLVPVEEKDLSQGLEIRVAFGGVWKESLTELSGGQRSLVALSLILALLLFKPAPVYILDEIDAALDLSHTQNIGKMLRAHFGNSQFIVISLKEGMFSNANVLFRVQNVNGQSSVRRLTGSARGLQAGGEREKDDDDDDDDDEE